MIRRAVSRLDKGQWDTAQRVASVTLAFEDRHRRRIRMTDDNGAAFLLDLAEAEHLNHGDGLVLEDGGILEVRAATEAVLTITCRDAAHTARLAWHIGNRHVPLQVLADGRLRIRADHVLADMLRGLGAEVRSEDAPFAPESGAYAAPDHGASDHGASDHSVSGHGTSQGHRHDA